MPFDYQERENPLSYDSKRTGTERERDILSQLSEPKLKARMLQMAHGFFNDLDKA